MNRRLTIASALVAAGGIFLLLHSRARRVPPARLQADEGSGGMTARRGPPELVRGTVTGGGSPIAGAEVIALPIASEEVAGCDRVSQRLEGLRSGAERLASARTDGDGAFSIEVGAPFRLVAIDPDRRLVGQVVVRAPAERIDLGVEPGQVVTGVAIDHEGQPVAGATVLAESGGVVLSGAAGEDGSFAIGPLPAGAAVATARRGDLIGFADVRGEAMTLRVGPAARLEVLVRRGDRPAPGASVELVSSTCVSIRIADDNGVVWFEEVAQQPLRLVASHEGWAAAVDHRVDQVRDRVVLALQPAAFVEGIVTSGAGAPVVGAEIVLTPAGRTGETNIPPPTAHRPVVLTSSAEGRFHAGAVPVGLYQISASADGFAAARLPARLFDSGPERIAIALAAEAPIRGQVVAEDGRPAAGVEVEAWTIDVTSRKLSRAERPVSVATTGADGRFELAGLACQPYTLRTRAGWHPPVVVEAPAERVTIALAAGARIFGRVLDHGGGPVGAARIEIRSLVRGLGSGFQRQLTADPSGRFAVDGVPPGELEIIADAPDGGRTSEYLRLERDAEVTLKLRGRLSLSGVVRTRAGQPVAAAEVVGFAQEPGGRPPLMHRTRSDRHGRFELGHLEAGVYGLAAHAEAGAVREPVVVDAGGPPVELLLEELPVLSGRVVDEARAPVVAFSVDGYLLNAPDGAFRLPLGNGGGRTIIIAAPGHAPVVHPVDPSGTRNQDLGEIVLSRPREIRGRVTDAGTGAPLVEARILASRTIEMVDTRGASIDLLPTATSDADGRFAVAAGAGAVPLVVEHTGYQRALLEVEAGQDNVAAALERAASIRGRVLDISGHGMECSVLVDGPTRTMVRTRPDGSFESPGLADGRYQVQASRLGIGGWRVLPPIPVEVSGHADQVIELREPSGKAALVVAIIGSLEVPDLILVELEGARVVNGVPQRGAIAFRYVDPGAYALVTADKQEVVESRIELSQAREYQLSVDLGVNSRDQGEAEHQH